MKIISGVLWVLLGSAFISWVILCFKTKMPMLIWGGVGIIVALIFWMWIVVAAQREFG